MVHIFSKVSNVGFLSDEKPKVHIVLLVFSKATALTNNIDGLSCKPQYTLYLNNNNGVNKNQNENLQN